MTLQLDGPGSSEDPARVVFSPVCLGCARLRVGSQTCEAFPKEIPTPIWNGQNTHRRPYPGDRGIVYEPLLAPDGATGIASGG